MNRPVPATVRSRRRYSILGDIGIACIVLAAPLRLRWEGLSELLVVTGIVLAVASCERLRRSIGHQDIQQEAELDEYELQRRYRAQRTALRWAVAFLVTVWCTIIILLMVFSRQGPESFEMLLTSVIACLYFTTAFIVFIPFLILRTIAGGMSKDLLVSGDTQETQT